MYNSLHVFYLQPLILTYKLGTTYTILKGYYLGEIQGKSPKYPHTSYKVSCQDLLITITSVYVYLQSEAAVAISDQKL